VTDDDLVGERVDVDSRVDAEVAGVYFTVPVNVASPSVTLLLEVMRPVHVSAQEAVARPGTLAARGRPSAQARMIARVHRLMVTFYSPSGKSRQEARQARLLAAYFSPAASGGYRL